MNELFEEHIKLYKEVFMTPLISVIVPVFNVQRFLPKCIESILKQSYKNLELILVDDGSSDKSFEICKKYEQKDSRVVAVSQQNGGVSSARNHGLRIAKGEYICFVDSDDWIPRKSIQLLYDAISSEDADLSVGAIQSIKETRKHIRFNPNAVISIGKDKEEFLNYVKQVYPGPVAKLYKNQIINKNSLQFPIEIASGEDTYFLCNYLEKCDSIRSISSIVYFYNRMNTSSAMHKYHSDFGKWSVLIVEVFNKLCNRVDSPFAKEMMSSIAKGYVYGSVKNYVSCDLPRTEAIKEIQSAYDNLKQYIVEKEQEESSLINVDTISQLLSEESGAETVYDELKKQEIAEKRSISRAVKQFIKNILRSIKYKWYFDLKL